MDRHRQCARILLEDTTSFWKLGGCLCTGRLGLPVRAARRQATEPAWEVNGPSIFNRASYSLLTEALFMEGTTCRRLRPRK